MRGMMHAGSGMRGQARLPTCIFSLLTTTLNRLSTPCLSPSRALYWLMAPQAEMRPKLFITSSTAARWAPPTLSK